MAQDSRVLRRGLPVRADPGAVLCGSTTVPQNGGGVPRLLGVERQPRVAHVYRRRLQRAQDRGVQVAPEPRRNRALDGATCQLVTEGDGAGLALQHAGGHAFVDVTGHVLEGRVEQPQLNAGRHERDTLQQTSRRRREPTDARQHRVTHRRRQRLGTRSKQLRHKERIPTGERIDRVPVGRVRGRELAHRRQGKRGNLHPLNRGHRRQLAEQAGQQVSIARLVITVGGDDERGRSADATTEDAQHVERRLVTPLHILEHDHHRLAQLLQQRQRHLARVPAGLDIQREPAADLPSDIEVPPERRHDQLLAGTEQNAPLNPRDEGPHQRRLAHARLATDKHKSPARAPGIFQPRQQRLAFDQP